MFIPPVPNQAWEFRRVDKNFRHWEEQYLWTKFTDICDVKFNPLYYNWTTY